MRKLKEKSNTTINNMYIEPIRQGNETYIQYNIYCNTSYIGKMTKFIEKPKWLVFFKSGTKHMLENVDMGYVLNWIKDNYKHKPLLVLRPVDAEQKIIYEVYDVLNLETNCIKYIIPNETDTLFILCDTDMTNKETYNSLFEAKNAIYKK